MRKSPGSFIKRFGRLGGMTASAVVTATSALTGSSSIADHRVMRLASALGPIELAQPYTLGATVFSTLPAPQAPIVIEAQAFQTPHPMPGWLAARTERQAILAAQTRMSTGRPNAGKKAIAKRQVAEPKRQNNQVVWRAARPASPEARPSMPAAQPATGPAAGEPVTLTRIAYRRPIA